MEDAERVAALRANGHDAHLLPDRRIVIRLEGKCFRVVGGDFRHPSLLELPGFFCLTLHCVGVPAYRFTWPGNDEKMACEECAARARGVAEAMGFHLQIKTLQ